MSDWPNTTENWGIGNWVIGLASPLCLGSSLRAVTASPITSSVAWPAANMAKFVPFRLPRQVTAYQMVVGFGSGGVSNNQDVGIYDEWGNRLVSTGSTATGGTSVEHVYNITDTVIGPGLYYMALAQDDTDTMIGISAAQTGLLKAVGIKEATSSFALPSTVTYATVTDTFLPAIGVWLRSE